MHVKYLFDDVEQELEKFVAQSQKTRRKRKRQSVHNSEQDRKDLFDRKVPFSVLQMLLASLSSLCLLTVTSKHHEYYSTNSMVIHQSNISRLTPAPPSRRVEHREHGTSIIVRDLFGNMPVRVKHRALLMQNRPELDKVWEELKASVTSLLVAFAKPVHVRLRETVSSRQFILNPAKSIQDHTDGIKGDLRMPSTHQIMLSLLFQYQCLLIEQFHVVFIKNLICHLPVSTSSEIVQYFSRLAVALL